MLVIGFQGRANQPRRKPAGHAADRNKCTLQVIYEHDVLIARGRVRKRKKKSSKPFRGEFGHTPLSMKENIPWDCRRLVVGTGADGALPVMDEVKREAARREVALVTVPTREAIRVLQAEPKDTNAILHVTC